MGCKKLTLEGLLIMNIKKVINHIHESFENWIESENLSEYKKDLDFIVRETKDEDCIVEICFESLLHDLINDDVGYFDHEKAEKIFGLSEYDWSPYASWKIDIHGLAD
jgi:hypothetical protein